jgi:hypothetical protein
MMGTRRGRGGALHGRTFTAWMSCRAVRAQSPAIHRPWRRALARIGRRRPHALVRWRRSPLGGFQGPLRGFYAAFFHPGVLRLGTCGEAVEIYAAQPGVCRGDYGECPPERELPEDAER